MSTSTLPPIELGRWRNLGDVEKQLTQFRRNSPPRGIVLATEAKGLRLGGTSALLQLLITWGRRHLLQDVTTEIPDNQDQAAALADLVSRDHGLVATMLAHEILSESGKRITADAKRLAFQRLDTLARGDIARVARPPSLLLPCLDDSPYAWLPAFYLGRKPKGKREYADLIQDVVPRIAPGHQFSHIRDDVTQSMETIVYELFRNTHEWARTDEKGARISGSLRSVRLELHDASKEELVDAAEGSPGLLTYLNDQTLQHDTNRQRFLELSILDSGAGLAAQWVGARGGRMVTIDDEYWACMSCLRKHHSSSSQAGRGLGLFEVLRMLTNVGGFLRLRTGRLSLFRNFELSPLEETEDAHGGLTVNRDDVRLYDWLTKSETCTTMEQVDGTLFTMLIPLRQQSPE